VAGPFVFEAGGTKPTYLDAFDDRPVVQSPNGRLGITVTGPKESLEAWVTVAPSTFPGGSVQVWPLEASAAVLWRPDSGAWALTDDRYANASFVLVCGTDFRMGENEPGLGVPITDLTPIVAEALDARVQKYYGLGYYQTDIPLFYAYALRWIGNDELLVGVSARIVGPAKPPNRDQENWDLAYLVDVPNKKVIREVTKAQLLTDYKIKVVDE